MTRAIDMKGKMIGEWTVIKRAGATSKVALWLCKCSCGTVRELEGTMLRKNLSQSCGCKKGELLSEANKKHGMSNSKLYRAHTDMKQRCSNFYHNLYPTHGERGISYDPEWETFQSFMNWALENGYSESSNTLARYDRTKSYTPTNCYWK